MSGFLDDLIDLFPHQVTIEPWTGVNVHSEATYGASTMYQAKIERGNRQVFGQGGDRAIVPKHKVFIAEALQVDVRDRITLPVAFGERNAAGAFVASSPIIRDVMPIFDETEQVCTIIYCG